MSKFMLTSFPSSNSPMNSIFAGEKSGSLVQAPHLFRNFFHRYCHFGLQVVLETNLALKVFGPSSATH